MARFVRTRPAPLLTRDYRKFRPYVRTDFAQTCAYCLLEEVWAAGEENFELDHFRPKSLYPDLVCDFYNLYYSCRPCNKIKHDAWPTAESQKNGIRFVDFCEDDFDAQFRETVGGEWEGLTVSARYTIESLRLNRRHLIEIRLIRRRINL
jgi:uncharacterized protein (TIGR02646 family)